MSNEITGYVKAQTGFLKNATKENLLNTTISFGGKFQKNGYFAKAEAGYGYSIYAQTELGKEFELNDVLSISTSAGGKYSKSTSKVNYYNKIFEKGDVGPEWKPFDARGYANAGVNFKGNWGEVGVGVQGGVKHSKKPNLPPEGLNEDIGMTKGTNITGSITKAYVTPTLNSKINLGKNFTLNANVALDEGNLGVAWNF